MLACGRGGKIVECGGGKREQEKEGGLPKAIRTLSGMINMFIILIMVMVSRVYTFVKTYQFEHFNYV